MRANEIEVQITLVSKAIYSLLDFRKIQILFTGKTCVFQYPIFKY